MDHGELQLIIKETIADISAVTFEHIEMHSMIEKDLQCDSLDCVELIMALEDKLDIIIDDDEVANAKSVQDIFDVVVKKV